MVLIHPRIYNSRKPEQESGRFDLQFLLRFGSGEADKNMHIVSIEMNTNNNSESISNPSPILPSFSNLMNKKLK